MINSYTDDDGNLIFMSTPTIYEIKRATKFKSPHFFDRDTLKFFGQTMKSFKVKKSPKGRIFIYAPIYDRYAEIRRGYTFRRFNGYDLLNISGNFESKYQILNYIEAWYKADPDRGEKSLHPELAKRIVRVDPETGKNRLEMMSATRLAERWGSGDGKKTPPEHQLKDITILDMHGDMASVKLETESWVDYMHLAKFNNEWVIINILWELK